VINFTWLHTPEHIAHAPARASAPTPCSCQSRLHFQGYDRPQPDTTRYDQTPPDTSRPHHIQPTCSKERRTSSSLCPHVEHSPSNTTSRRLPMPPTQALPRAHDLRHQPPRPRLSPCLRPQQDPTGLPPSTARQAARHAPMPATHALLRRSRVFPPHRHPQPPTRDPNLPADPHVFHDTARTECRIPRCVRIAFPSPPARSLHAAASCHELLPHGLSFAPYIHRDLKHARSR